MLNEATLVEISDILDSFNLDEISKLLDEQIDPNIDDDDIYTQTVIDHFQPLYYNYAKLLKCRIDDEIREEAETKFISICKIFLEKIFKKFHLTMDNDWIDDNYRNIPATTMAFYSFFVLDFSTNVNECVTRYIFDNINDIVKIFDGMKTKKDASTMSNKKSLSPETGLVISNIYDIITWCLDQMTEEQYLSQLKKQKYLPVDLISALMAEEKLSCHFMEVIREIYRVNVALRGSVGFQIIYKVKTGEIKDPFGI